MRYHHVGIPTSEPRPGEVYLPELGCTSAELSAAEKNRLSHRGQALAELKRKLEDARVQQ